MNLHSHTALAAAVIAIAAGGSGCAVREPPPPPQRVYYQPVPPVPTYVEPAPRPVVSIYIEPPILQPEPILVGWAPPPMLVEMPAPLPYDGAVWVGGYWVWDGNWVWAAGHWMAPPRPSYVWVHPYYEHRGEGVIFITGHWNPPGVYFVPPPISLSLTLVAPRYGVVPGPRPIGPQGVFVPPPPGSRFGLIVPAPIGTAPAVVTSAAPVVNVGMRIQNNNTTTNNTNVTHVTNITNITNVTIVAPASATASGKAFESAVPAQAHLAAALPPMVRAPAPVPASRQAVPAFVPGHAPAALPPPQTVHELASPPPHEMSPRGATTFSDSPPPHAAVAPAPAAVVAPPPPPLPTPKPLAAIEHPSPPPVPQRPTAESPHLAVPAASALQPAHVLSRPANSPRDEARIRVEQEHAAKAEAAAHRVPGTQEEKKKEDGAERDDRKAP